MVSEVGNRQGSHRPISKLLSFVGLCYLNLWIRYCCVSFNKCNGRASPPIRTFISAWPENRCITGQQFRPVPMSINIYIWIHLFISPLSGLLSPLLLFAYLITRLISDHIAHVFNCAEVGIDRHCSNPYIFRPMIVSPRPPRHLMRTAPDSHVPPCFTDASSSYHSAYLCSLEGLATLVTRLPFYHCNMLVAS